MSSQGPFPRCADARSRHRIQSIEPPIAIAIVATPQMISPHDEGPGPSVKYVGTLETIAAAAQSHPVPNRTDGHAESKRHRDGGSAASPTGRPQ